MVHAIQTVVTDQRLSLPYIRWAPVGGKRRNIELVVHREERREVRERQKEPLVEAGDDVRVLCGAVSDGEPSPRA